MRLWLRDELREIESYLITLLKAIAERAEVDIDCLMPGYTHLQRGQVCIIVEYLEDSAKRFPACSLEPLAAQLWCLLF